MEKRKHHYIPQFYLRYFTDPLTPLWQKPYVWILNKKDESIKNKAPVNFAFKRGYNDIIDADGNISNIVEDQFMDIEGVASGVLNKINKYKELKYISKTERFFLSKFILSMMLRVPTFRDTFNNIIEEGYVHELPNNQLKNNIIRSKLSMDSVIRTTYAAGHLLQRMSWSLLIAPDSSNFIASDNPVIVRIPDDPNWIFVGFGHPKAQITFPINPKICLFGEWDRSIRIIEKIDHNEVNRINLETYKNSHEFVYSNSEYFKNEIFLLNHLVNIVELSNLKEIGER